MKLYALNIGFKLSKFSGLLKSDEYPNLLVKMCNIELTGECIFKAEALWADAFYYSKCPSVCLSVCSLLRYRLKVFLPPIPEVRCPIIFRDSKSLGKSNGKKWSQIGTFLFESCLKSPRKKKFFFSHFFHF